MLNENEARQIIGKTAYSNDGDKIGKIGQVFLDDQTGQPEFLTVNTGLFGTSESFVPVDGASLKGEDVTVPFDKNKVKDAPRVDLDGNHLDESDERRLYEYYGRSYGAGDAAGTGQHTETAGHHDTDASGHHDADAASLHDADTAGHHDADTAGHRDTDTAGVAGTQNQHATEGYDTSGPTTDDAMTRSEERLEVGKTSEAAGRARLRKYVTTENETVSVPVTKERAVLETEPVTGTNADNAHDGPAISEEEHEVVLNEERVVVDKVAEPVERVKLGTEQVTEEQTVSDEVRKENIEVEGDVDRR